jgi:hypothetical protein
MTGGAELSARERRRARARAGRPRGWAVMLGRAGASERGHGRVAAGRSARPSRREKGESAPEKSFVFLLKNVNSVSICLFRLNFCRAPKIVKIVV